MVQPSNSTSNSYLPSYSQVAQFATNAVHTVNDTLRDAIMSDGFFNTKIMNYKGVALLAATVLAYGGSGAVLGGIGDVFGGSVRIVVGGCCIMTAAAIIQTVNKPPVKNDPAVTTTSGAASGGIKGYLSSLISSSFSTS